jgi:hypothetical protein
MNEVERWNTALMIAINDLERPHHDTRQKATDQDVTLEFHLVREDLLRYAHSLLAFKLSE